MSEFEQVRDAIAKIAKSCEISEDDGITLLVAHNWDQTKILNIWDYKSEEICNSLNLIPTFSFESFDIQRRLRQAPCGICDKDRECQLFGCRHAICPLCIEGYAYSKLMDGQLILKCPIASCGKVVSSSLILHNLPVEATVMFNESLTNHFLSSKAKKDKSALVHVETILATSYKIFKMVKGFGTKLWRNKKSIFASSLVVVFFCHFFCVGNTTSCAAVLLLMNLLAIVFNLWGNVMKTLLLCLFYKLVQVPTYTFWIVGVLSIICAAYLIVNLVGGSLLLITNFILRMF